jgi:hypothetical protein
MSQIDLYNFLSDKTIIHSEYATDYKTGLLFFVENKKCADAITYNSVRHFSIYNISMFELDEKGNYFYEFSIDKNGDIIDNITLEHLPNINAQLTYYISSKKFLPEEVNKFVICAAMYTDFKVRVTFLEKPDINSEFRVIMRNYLLQSELREMISNSPLGVKCGNIRYYNGIVDNIK